MEIVERQVVPRACWRACSSCLRPRWPPSCSARPRPAASLRLGRHQGPGQRLGAQALLFVARAQRALPRHRSIAASGVTTPPWAPGRTPAEELEDAYRLLPWPGTAPPSTREPSTPGCGATTRQRGPLVPTPGGVGSGFYVDSLAWDGSGLYAATFDARRLALRPRHRPGATPAAPWLLLKVLSLAWDGSQALRRHRTATASGATTRGPGSGPTPGAGCPPSSSAPWPGTASCLYAATTSHGVWRFNPGAGRLDGYRRRA